MSRMHELDKDSLSTHQYVRLSLTISMVIIFSSVLLFYIVYKRRMRKTFSSQIKDEINKALKDYYEQGERGTQIDD